MPTRVGHSDGNAHISAEAGFCQDAHQPCLFVDDDFGIGAVAAIGMFRLPPTIGQLI